MNLARLTIFLACLLAAAAAAAQEPRATDAPPHVPFQQGDLISFDQIDKLRAYLPAEFWKNRDYFFYEGMEIEIGPTQRKYEGNAQYEAATERFRGQAAVGRDGSLENHIAGRPFPNDTIDCKGDPDAGTKIIWNFMRAWRGTGAQVTWSYTYWDRGEQLPLFYKGRAVGVALSKRVEPRFLDKNGGHLFKKEKRLFALAIDVLEPFDARGVMLLQYRYKSSEAPLDQAKNDDTWIYVPDLRRTRRISTAQRTDPIQGTDFTMDDLRGFAGIPPQYSWECLGEGRYIAPMNTKHLAYPYRDDYNFGPFGYSFANDRWELRDAWILRFDPKNEDHPYHHKDIYIDKETYEPLYSFAYDRKRELWKIIWHNHRYSEDWNGNDPLAKDGVWYPSWKGVDEVRDLREISDIIVNVQTGTGNRIDMWNNQGSSLPSRGKVRRYIDIGRLNRGR